MAKRRTKRKAKSRLKFKFDFKRILATFFAGVIGIGVIEFILGYAFWDVFVSSPVFNIAAGMQGFLMYVIGASIIFGVVFYLLEQSTMPKTNLKEGIRLGFIYGVIVAAPWYVLNFFLSTHTQAYLLGSLIILLLDYVAAGGLAGFILSKMD
jgi:uncharacterized membrane protein